MNGEILNEFAAYPWEADFLTDSEWWDMAFDIVSRSFSYVLGNDFLRMFAVLAFLVIVIGLCNRLVRLSRLR